MLCQFYEASDGQLAEDIVSETFVKAMKALAYNEDSEIYATYQINLAQPLEDDLS